MARAHSVGQQKVQLCPLLSVRLLTFICINWAPVVNVAACNPLSCRFVSFRAVSCRV